jgi:hypothetical protein
MPVAKYNTKQKEIMWERDNWCCILCWANSSLQFHHCFFGQESMRTPDRNDPKYGVTICALCHWQCHASPRWEWKRQEAINYLNNIYGAKG